MFLQAFTVGYVHWLPLSCGEIHTLWRITIYIGLLSFSPILAIDANGGEVSESCVEKFRELSPLALVLFLSICISFACTIGCCIAWWCIIPYINSLESDCHQLPKWGRLIEHVVPPCLVLVIDDNLYGLMVALSIFEGFVRRLFLEYMRWFQGEFVMTKVLFKELPKDWWCERLIKTKSKSESSWSTHKSV